MKRHQDQEVSYLADALGKAIEGSGMTRLAFEKRLGVSRGYLSKILGGGVELRLQHLFDILRVLKISPAHFFHAAYPQASGPADPETLRAVEGLAETKQAERPASPDSDLDRRVREALARIILGDHSQP